MLLISFLGSHQAAMGWGTELTNISGSIRPGKPLLPGKDEMQMQTWSKLPKPDVLVLSLARDLLFLNTFSNTCCTVNDPKHLKVIIRVVKQYVKITANQAEAVAFSTLFAHPLLNSTSPLKAQIYCISDLATNFQSWKISQMTEAYSSSYIIRSFFPHLYTIQCFLMELNIGIY